MKALVIEDDIRLSEMIAECLTTKGIEVKVAADSITGIQMAHQFPPNFILLDLMLPAGGGMMVLESMQKSAAIQNIPVIIMTGSQDVALKNKLLQYGIKTYLQKPFNLDDLLTAIADLLAPPPKPGP
jgi:DNA-binding response OmpR family regulator